MLVLELLFVKVNEGIAVTVLVISWVIVMTLVDTVREQAEDVAGVVIVNREVVLVSMVVVVGSMVLELVRGSEVDSPSMEDKEEDGVVLVLVSVLDSEDEDEEALLALGIVLDSVLDSEVKVEETEEELIVEVGSIMEVNSKEVDSTVELAPTEKKVGSILAVASIVVVGASW